MNYATSYSNTVPKTRWAKTDLEAPLIMLDRAATYLKNIIVACDGVITWVSGSLAWSDDIHIYFIDDEGTAKHNSIAAGSLALTDGQVAYVDLNKTNNSVLTAAAAAVTSGSASNTVTYNRIVLGYRNADDDLFYPVYLSGTVAARTLVHNDIEQAVTCADTVTVNWQAGRTARMTFDRDTVALTISGGVNGGTYRLLLIQGDGSDVLTYSTTIKWRGGAAPTLSTAAGAIDLLTFNYINGVWYGHGDLAFATV